MAATLSTFFTLGLLVWGGYNLSTNTEIGLESDFESDIQASVETEADWYSHARLEIEL